MTIADPPTPFDAYSGSEPYVFISYARDDSRAVFPAIRRLQDAGYRVWYDRGIEIGADWPAAIVRALEHASALMVFLSSRAANSEFVQNEFVLAARAKKRLLVVRMDDEELPAGWKLWTTRLQVIEENPDTPEAWERLARALPANTRHATVSVALDVVGVRLPMGRRWTLVGASVASLLVVAVVWGLLFRREVETAASRSDQTRISRAPGPHEGGEASAPEAPRATESPMPRGSFSKSIDRHTIDLTLPTGIHLPLVLLDGGSFVMGSAVSERDRQSDETPHTVRLTQPFYIGKYEVTQEQFDAVMQDQSSSPYPHVNQFEGHPQNPVEKMDWDRAAEFGRRLSAQLKAIVRLPTEAEWEYACRAGEDAQFSIGNDESALETAAWFVKNSQSVTHQVGLKAPNKWGLYDILGNVKEWTGDWYDEKYYKTSPVVNPTGPPAGTERVARGGGIKSEAESSRCAYRGRQLPDRKDSDRGFRIVMLPTTPP